MNDRYHLSNARTASHTSSEATNDDNVNHGTGSDGCSLLPQTTITNVSNPSCSKEISMKNFHGDNSKVSARNWLFRFEMLSDRMKWLDSDKFFSIGNYLSDEAGEWYITTVRRNEKMESEELKELFLKRFDIKLVNPLVEFCRLKYDQQKGIKSYFEKKRELGMDAELSESQIVILMIDGLPPSLSSFFTTIKPPTMDEFYNIARQAETNLRLNDHHKSRRVNHESKRATHAQKREVPPSPCKICEEKGKPGCVHYTYDCWSNTKNSNPVKKSKNASPPNRIPIAKCFN